MAYGYGPNAPAHAPEGTPEARLAFGAVRTGADAASIEVTAGLDLYYDGDGRHLHRSLHRPGLAGPGELIPSWETAPAYVGTTRLRCAWRGVAAPPDVVELRTFPRLGCVNRIVLPFWRELPDLHWESGHPEVDERDGTAQTMKPLVTGYLKQTVGRTGNLRTDKIKTTQNTTARRIG